MRCKTILPRLYVISQLKQWDTTYLPLNCTIFVQIRNQKRQEKACCNPSSKKNHSSIEMQCIREGGQGETITLNFHLHFFGTQRWSKSCKSVFPQTQSIRVKFQKFSSSQHQKQKPFNFAHNHLKHMSKTKTQELNSDQQTSTSVPSKPKIEFKRRSSYLDPAISESALNQRYLHKSCEIISSNLIQSNAFSEFRGFWNLIIVGFSFFFATTQFRTVLSEGTLVGWYPAFNMFNR